MGQQALKMNDPPDWPAKHPAIAGGTHPYVPPRVDSAKPSSSRRSGWLPGSAENEWVPHNTNDPVDFHWDPTPEWKATNISPENREGAISGGGELVCVVGFEARPRVATIK